MVTEDDTDTSPALDTSEPQDNAVDVIDAALQHGRAKYGLPTDDQQGAIPNQQVAQAAPHTSAFTPNFTNMMKNVTSGQPQTTEDMVRGIGGAPLISRPIAELAGGAGVAYRVATGRAPTPTVPRSQVTYPPDPNSLARGGPVLRFEDGDPVPEVPDDGDQTGSVPSLASAEGAMGSAPAATQYTPDDTLKNRLFPPSQSDTPALPTGAPAPTPQMDPNEGQGMATDSNMQAYLSRSDAMSNEKWNRAHSAQEEKYPDKSPSFINHQTILSLPGKDMQFNGVQHMAKQSDHEANQVRLLITKPEGERDTGKIADGFEKMLSYNTDGSTVKVKDVGNGLLRFDVRGGHAPLQFGPDGHATPGQGPGPASFTLNLDQQHDLANIGKAGQFDTMHENGVIGTLDALSKTAGTPVPSPKVPDKSLGTNELSPNGPVPGRYTKGELAELAASKLNAFGMPSMQPLSGAGQSDIDFLDKRRTARVGAENELAKAQAGMEGRKEVAGIQAGARVANNQNTVDQKREASNALNKFRYDNMKRLGMTAQQGDIIRMYDAAQLAGDKSNPALMQAGAAIMAKFNGGQQQGGDQTYQPAPAPNGQQAAPAPTRQPTAPAPTRGINPKTNAPADGEFRPGQTVYDKQGQPHIVGQ